MQEEALHVQAYNSLTYVAKELERGWCSGYLVDPNGRKCLIGAVERVTFQMPKEVRLLVLERLAAELPDPLRRVAKVSPRMALMGFNDLYGADSTHVVELVSSALNRYVPLAVPAEDSLALTNA